MIRILIFFLLAAVLALAAVWLAGQSGGLVLSIAGYEISMSLAVAAGLFVAGAAALLLIHRLLLSALSAPESVTRWRKDRRERKGLRVLSRGLVAAAAGDTQEALSYAGKARALLGAPPLALLLGAQAAQLADDEDKAAENYREMLGAPGLEFLGLRGLFMQALRRNDNGSALAYAERAFALRPRAQWVIQALFDLNAREKRWNEASRALDAAGGARVLDDKLIRRRRAVLLGAEAIGLEDKGQGDEALKKGLAALALSPALAAIAVLAARKLAAQKRTWKAAGIIEAAWAQAPHPDLAAIYGSLKPNENAGQRAKRFEALIALNKDHAESRLLAAAQALAARDFALARGALEPLLSPSPTTRVCALMAEIEHVEHGDSVKSREWLARSLKAPRDAYWFCAQCARPSAHWAALCAQCGAFDALEWKAPREPEMALLPLLEDGDVARLLYRQAETPDAAMPPVQDSVETGERERPAPPRAGEPQAMLEMPRPPDDPGPGGDDYSEAAPGKSR